MPKLRDVSLGETIRIAKEKIGWGKVKLEKNQGIGIATGSWIESAGPGGGAIVKVNEDGSVTVHIGKIDMGTIPGFGIPMIVAEELGIPVSDVTVVNVDTDASPWDAGTVGSRGILVSGTASRLAAIDARNQIFKMAARQLEASPDDLEIVDKQIRVKGTPAKAVPLATIATNAHNVIGEVIGRGYCDNVAMMAERKSPRQLAAVHGACLHRRSESRHRQREDFEIRRRARHRPADPSSRRRRPDRRRRGHEHRPGALRASRLRQRRPHHEPVLRRLLDADHQHDAAHRNDAGSGYPGAGPYGAKGAGEIACVPPMAAIANAIYNATGVRITKLPLSPENVLRGVEGGGESVDDKGSETSTAGVGVGAGLKPAPTFL